MALLHWLMRHVFEQDRYLYEYGYRDCCDLREERACVWRWKSNFPVRLKSSWHINVFVKGGGMGNNGVLAYLLSAFRRLAITSELSPASCRASSLAAARLSKLPNRVRSWLRRISPIPKTWSNADDMSVWLRSFR